MHIRFRQIKTEYLHLFIRPFAACVCWLIFYITGAHLATIVSPDTLSILRTHSYSYVSIVFLAIAAILPYILSSLILRFCSWHFLLPLIGAKAYTMGFAGALIFLAYPGAGWLMRWLLVFTSSVQSVVILFFWLSNINDPAENAFKSTFTYSIWTFVCVALDCFCVYPFSLSLF